MYSAVVSQNQIASNCVSICPVKILDSFPELTKQAQQLSPAARFDGKKIRHRIQSKYDFKYAVVIGKWIHGATPCLFAIQFVNIG